MKKANLDFQDINWKNHSALGEQGVQGTLTIGQYELSVVAGQGLYSTAGKESFNYFKPNSYNYYISYEVAVFKDTDDGKSQEFTDQFYYGDFDTNDSGLGWQSKYRINELIKRIEDSLKTDKIDFNSSYDQQEITSEFKEIEPTIPTDSLKAIKEIAKSGTQSNQEQNIKHQAFVDAGWVEGDNLKLVKEDRETEHSYILGDTKYTITVYSIDLYVKIKYLSYEKGSFMPFLKWRWTIPTDAYATGYSYTKRKNGKYTCYSIVGSERQYSAQGLLKKINEVNNESRWSFNAYIRELQAFNKAKELLQDKYPKATVKKGYAKYDHTFRKIDLVFKSGSTIQFNVCDYGDTLLKLDKVTDKQKLTYDNWEGWADRFNNQKEKL